MLKLFNIFLSFFLSCSMLISCVGKQPEAVQKEIPEGEHNIESTMTYLASDACRGRLPNTLGNYAARDYILDIYQKLNLSPYDEDYINSYKQEVFDPATSTQELTVVYEDGSEKTYAYGTDFLGLMFKGANMKAEVTTDATKATDKILLLDENSPKLNVLETGAIALFKKTDTFFRSNRISEKGIIRVKVKEELYSDLTTNDIAHVSYKDHIKTEEVLVDNLIGVIKGKDSTKALVLSAHYDHMGYVGDTIFRGAIDNASGISVILEIADRLSDYTKDNPLDMDIIIAAFNGEESGLKGSSAFVKDVKKRYETLYNINVDCVGKKDGGPIVTNGQRESTGMNDSLKKALMHTFEKEGVVLLDEYYGASDHASFNDMNYPGVTLGQKDVLGENNTTKIHTVQDTLDIVDYTALDNTVNAIFQFILNNNGEMFQTASNQPEDEMTIKDAAEFLTSDLCNGRSPGTKGNEHAASYISSFYNQIGLTPYDEDYYHSYTQKVYDPAHLKQTLEIIYSDGSKKSYMMGDDFVGALSNNIDVTADISTDTEDTNNKAVVYESYTSINYEDSGAACLLKRRDHLKKSNVIVEKPLALAYISNELYDELHKDDAEAVHYASNFKSNETEVNNVVGIIKGNSHKKALILSAHFDHVGFTDNFIYRGAVDNASGTAILLELAENLNHIANRKSFDMDIIFVAFNGEESGLLGSKAFAKDIKDQYETLYSINLDCIGKKKGGSLTIHTGSSELNDTLTDALQNSFKESDFELFPWGNVASSDHHSFNEQGIPSVSLINEQLMGKNGTPSIHTKDDTTDLLDYDYMEKVMEAIIDFIQEHDGQMFQEGDVSLTSRQLAA